MNLPKKVKVAGFDIQIEEWTSHKANTAQCFGEFVALESMIRIDMSINRFKIVDTLIHEILHTIHWAYNIQDEDKEERIVSVMSTAWTQIYRDNPELLHFIAETLKEDM